MDNELNGCLLQTLSGFELSELRQGLRRQSRLFVVVLEMFQDPGIFKGFLCRVSQVLIHGKQLANEVDASLAHTSILQRID